MDLTNSIITFLNDIKLGKRYICGMKKTSFLSVFFQPDNTYTAGLCLTGGMGLKKTAEKIGEVNSVKDSEPFIFLFGWKQQ